MIDIKAVKPAKRYAQAFFEIISNKDYDKILSEIDIFLNELCENSEFRDFLYHPVVKTEDKKDAIKQIFSFFTNETMDFLYVLVDENRINCLCEIKNFLSEKINDKNKIIPLDVYLSIEVDDDMKNFIKAKLENKFKAKIIVDFKLDKSIIGGILVKIKDTIIDLSIKKKLENFKRA